MKKHNSFKILAAVLSACLTMNLAFTAAMADEYTAEGDHSGVNATLPEADESSGGSKQKPPVSDEGKADTDAASGQRNGGASPLGQVTNTGEFDETLDIDKGAVQIDSDTGRAYCDLENDTVLNGSGLIYYTPPSEAGEPALLKLVDVCVKDDAEAMLAINCNDEIPVVVEVEGENSVELSWASEVTLTGTGKLNKMLLTSKAFSKGDFTGELNAFTAVCAIVSEGTVLYLKYDFTVYGNYVETASPVMPIAAYSEEEGATLICTFTISEGASYTVSEGVSVIFYNLGEDYEDYLSIQGDFINNGSVVYASETPLAEPQKLFDFLNLSGDGLVFVSEELDSVDNADIYNNDGFVSGGIIDNWLLEIDETVTEKTFYVLANGGRIYYTPSAGEGLPARLKLSEVSDGGFSLAGSVNIPVILETEGENYLREIFWFPGNITLTGNGDLFVDSIMTSDFTVSEDFTGDLNALVTNAVVSGNDFECVRTVYGSYYATDFDIMVIAGIESEEDGSTQKTKFVIPAGAEFEVGEDVTVMISNVGTEYGDYLKIDGKFINNGTIICDGNVPDDPEEFIRSLKLTGTGYVVIRYDSGEVCYSNDGLMLTYTTGDLNFEDDETIRGDHIDEHGYSFNESEDGSYVLTLKDFSTPYQVRLPGDKPVIINSSGVCYIGDLSISHENSIPVTFEGDGELTVNDSLKFSKSCQIIVAEGARVTTNSGVTAYEGVGQIIVNGSYTAICGSNQYDEAVLADCIRIGPDGIMNVRGRRGVCLYRDSDADYPSFFIEEGGRFIADCGEYGLAICNSGSIDGTVSIPEGYLPHGYVFVKAEDSMYDDRYCMLLALEGSEITFYSYMREIESGEGAEGYIVLHPHSGDYDKFIPDLDNPEQHIKSCSNDPKHSDSAAPHAFGDWEYADEAGHEGEHKHTCEECGYTAYEKCSGGAATCEKGKLCETCGHEYSDPLGHDLGKWTYDGNGGHTQKCSRCDYTKTEQCTWGEWVQTKDPTETETGLKIRTCTVCGGEESEVVPVVEPDPDNPDPDTPDPDNPDPDNPDPDNPDPDKPDPDNPDPDDPDKDTTLTDNKTGVSVSGAIPEGAELLVTIDTENSTASRLYFDISLVKDGQKCQPEGKVTVKIPVPEEMRDIAETLKVYHFADEKYTNMNARLEDGCLVFETDHFSVYVVTADVIEEDDNNGDNTTDKEPEPVIKPDTGDFKSPETTTEAAADTTSAPKPSETTGVAGENSASDENGTAAETDGAAPNEASTAPVPDNGNSEQPVSADIADNGTENTGNSGAANGSAEENNPNTGLGMAVIPLFIAAASASLIIYNKKK